ncbi:SDR family oxidoreductase [Candidatus Villigracilis saccharophilus]|uniref:SDR family NAD(P)-dependent oxidoreductase n=1 Tax=Candidatus Villigracilis saccharophilus TaxID=3140684 RepID=UPI0031347D31|nr:SDR family oxidoreductase [Anaerolineales bacterium]
MPNLKNKVVLITGASSGFGEDAALLFAQAGCRVILAARRIDRLQDLAQKIQDAGGEAIAIPVDITNTADVDDMVKSALDIYGQIDILFNNAGIGRVDWFEKHSLDRDIAMLVQVNLTALMQVTRTVLPHMLKRREGHIINMVSVAGLIASPLITSYAASKHGARAFTDALRREVAPLGIKVSGIYPGPAATEFGQHIGKSRTYGSVRKSFSSRMTSAYVARRVLDVAKRPRRSLVIPWWFRLVTTFDMLFPVVVDGILYVFSKKNHKLD